MLTLTVFKAQAAAILFTVVPVMIQSSAMPAVINFTAVPVMTFLVAAPVMIPSKAAREMILLLVALVKMCLSMLTVPAMMSSLITRSDKTLYALPTVL